MGRGRLVDLNQVCVVQVSLPLLDMRICAYNKRILLFASRKRRPRWESFIPPRLQTPYANSLNVLGGRPENSERCINFNYT